MAQAPAQPGHRRRAQPTAPLRSARRSAATAPTAPAYPRGTPAAHKPRAPQDPVEAGVFGMPSRRCRTRSGARSGYATVSGHSSRPATMTPRPSVTPDDHCPNSSDTAEAVPDLRSGRRDGPPPGVHPRHRQPRSTSATWPALGNAGSDENTNGLLRRHFPKETDLSVHTSECLAFAADHLNRPPGKEDAANSADPGVLLVWICPLVDELPQDATPFATPTREAELLSALTLGTLSPIGAQQRI